jgi:hypothetical protein
MCQGVIEIHIHISGPDPQPGFAWQSAWLVHLLLSIDLQHFCAASQLQSCGISRQWPRQLQGTAAPHSTGTPATAGGCGLEVGQHHSAFPVQILKRQCPSVYYIKPLWSFGFENLYHLCTTHPGHSSMQQRHPWDTVELCRPKSLRARGILDRRRAFEAGCRRISCLRALSPPTVCTGQVQLQARV